MMHRLPRFIVHVGTPIAFDKPSNSKWRTVQRLPLILIAPSTGRSFSNLSRGNLGELGHQGNHEVEKSDSLNESETQNGVGEELATESGVAGNTVDEGSENDTDTNTSTGQTDGRRTHTQVLGDLNHGLGDLGRVGAALSLEGVAASSLDGLALHGLHGAASGDGALGSGEGSTHGRASSLGGHLGGQAGGEDTGGHCDGLRRDWKVGLEGLDGVR